MQLSGKVLPLLALVWCACVALYPSSSGDPTIAGGNETSAVGEEGLYRSALTSAGFGLLGVRIYETGEDAKHWRIKSRFAELHRKENYAFLEDVIAEFISKKSKNVVTTKSRYGRSRLDQQRVDLEGNVSIRSTKGYLFTMDTLAYDGKSHELSTEDAVYMKGPNPEKPTITLHGTGLLGDVDNEHFFLKRGVVAQRKLSKPLDPKNPSAGGDWLRVTSVSGEFFTNEGRAVFLKKVRANMPTASMDSDLLEVTVVEDSESLRANGHVVLKSRDRVGEAETAHIAIGSNLVVLEGRAQVRDQKNNRLSGRRILMYTDSDRIEVEDAQGRGQE